MHMDQADECMQTMSVEARCWRKLRLGLKPTNRFMCEMSIQSLFDQRSFYKKLCKIMSGDRGLTFAKVLTSAQINHMLREFHLKMTQHDPNTAELQVPPQTGGYRNHNGGVRAFVRPEISEE